MAKLFIQDTTLTAIADAIREKTGASAPAYEYYDYMSVADGRKSMGAGDYEYISYTFPGATSIKVQVTWMNKQYTGITTGKGVFMICEGAVTSGGYGGVDVTSGLVKEYQSDSFTIYVTGKCSVYSWELKVYGYDADGNQIQYAKEIEGGSAPATYKPTEMPAAILSISGEGGGGITPVGTKDILENGDYDVTQYANAHVAVPVGVFPSGDLAISANGKYTVTEKETVTVLCPTGITPEGTKEITVNGTYDVTNFASALVNVPTGGTEIPAVQISGYAEYACANPFAAVYIEQFPDKVSTWDLSGSCKGMFYNTGIKEIPFDLNFSIYADAVDCTNMFGNASFLEKLPKMEGMPVTNMSNMCAECLNLKDVSALAGINMSNFEAGNYNMGNYVFNNCQSLRSVPSSFLKSFGRSKYSYNSGHPYSNIFYGCCNLDEVIDLGVSPQTYSSNNMFNTNPFYGCCALRRFTFEMNEDGTPKTARWNKQVINLTGYVGWGVLGMYGGTYEYMNSGRSYANLINDAADYEEKKNHPDRIAVDTSEYYSLPYATYNKASAVETINTLPDCSGYGGTNTIKFKGDAGSATDEGAINTMTDAEIAVAAAKGWTVTFE